MARRRGPESGSSTKPLCAVGTAMLDWSGTGGGDEGASTILSVVSCGKNNFYTGHCKADTTNYICEATSVETLSGNSQGRATSTSGRTTIPSRTNGSAIVCDATSHPSGTSTDASSNAVTEKNTRTGAKTKGAAGQTTDAAGEITTTNNTMQIATPSVWPRGGNMPKGTRTPRVNHRLGRRTKKHAKQRSNICSRSNKHDFIQRNRNRRRNNNDGPTVSKLEKPSTSEKTDIHPGTAARQNRELCDGMFRRDRYTLCVQTRDKFLRVYRYSQCQAPRRSHAR